MQLIDRIKLKTQLSLKTNMSRNTSNKNKWSNNNGFIRRKYKSYDSYILHQESKLPLLYDKLKKENPQAVQKFIKRFNLCNIPSNSSILCLGARIGSEVEALRELGHFAVGIDLNPGPKNRFVTYGDFHHLSFKDKTVDIIYTNCLDHIYNLDIVLQEIVRVLKDNGTCILDIMKGYKENKKTSVFDTFHWEKAEDFANLVQKKTTFTLITLRNLQQVDEPNWYQAIFKKGDFE